MDLAAFRATLDGTAPPAGLGPALEALWHVARGDWPRAHGLVDQGASPTEAWVHAHLHRIEGDLSNAGYWYRRAGRNASETALEAEWAEIAAALLAGRGPRPS